MTRMTRPLLICLVLLLPIASSAQLGFTLGTEYGVGLRADLGSSQTSLQVGAGFVPFVLIWETSRQSGFGSSSEEINIKFYTPASIGAKLSFKKNPAEDPGIRFKFGVSYNDLLRWGYGGGVDHVVSERTTVSAGVMFFPDAFDRLLAKVNEEEGTFFDKDDVSMPLSSVQIIAAYTIFFGE